MTGRALVKEGLPRHAPVIRILRQRVPMEAFVHNHFAGYAPEAARQLVALLR